MARYAVLALLAVALASAAISAGQPAASKRFHGSVIIDAPIKGIPRAVVARTADPAAAACGSGPIDEHGSYDLVVKAAGPRGCHGTLLFWLRQSGAREVPFAETATYAGPRSRRLDLHILAPMRTYGDVISARDLEGAAVVACSPSCTTPAHTTCGGGRVFGFTFAARIAPRTPELGCPASDGRFRFALRTEDGALYPATAVGHYESNGSARFDLIAGFPRQDSVADFTENQPASMSRGERAAFRYNVRLRRTRPTMNWWVTIEGPEGTRIRSIAATDPIVNQPEHNTWVCNLFPRLPGPNADPRSARCAGFVGAPPPGVYTLLIEVEAPPASGTIAVELFNVAGQDHTRERITIAVR